MGGAMDPLPPPHGYATEYNSEDVSIWIKNFFIIVHGYDCVVCYCITI